MDAGQVGDDDWFSIKQGHHYSLNLVGDSERGTCRGDGGGKLWSPSAAGGRVSVF